MLSVKTRGERPDRGLRRKTPRRVDLGERIHIAREASDLSQSELARRIGVRSQSVNQWESGYKPKPTAKLPHPGVKRPSLQSIIRIAACCNVATDWLLFGSGGLTHTDLPATIPLPQLTGRGVPMLTSIKAAVALRGGNVATSKRQVMAPFPCSDLSFAFPLPDERCAGSGDHAGDIWVVDPKRKPKPGDMVLGVFGDEEPVIGEYRGDTSTGKLVEIVQPTDMRWPAARSDLGKLEIIAVRAGRIQPSH